MQSRHCLIIQQKTTEKHHFINKLMNAYLIIPMVLIINFQYLALLISNIKVRDEIITQYKKNIQIENIDTAIKDSIPSTEAILIQIQTLFKEKEYRLSMSKTYESKLNKLRDKTKDLMKKREIKHHYLNLSKTISAMLPALLLEKTESMTRCTFISNCYRMTRDGYSAKAFHQNCAGLKPTVALVKSDMNAIFGGITYESWDDNQLKFDPKAYLFSVVLEVKYQLKDFDKPSINTSDNLLPTFGADDIYVSETEAYVNNPMKSYRTITDDYIDKHRLTLTEIEVYHMKCEPQKIN